MKKILFLLTIFALSTNLVWAKSFTIDVTMSCMKCAANIEAALNEKYPNAVTNFKAYPDKNTLSLDSETLTEDQIKEVIHNAGYTLIKKK